MKPHISKATTQREARERRKAEAVAAEMRGAPVRKVGFWKLRCSGKIEQGDRVVVRADGKVRKAKGPDDKVAGYAMGPASGGEVYVGLS